MAFVFPLQGLLRVREAQEQAELQGLQALAAQVASARAEIAALETLGEQARRTLWEDACAGISGAELHFSAARESARAARRQSLHARLQEIERAQQAQLKRYLHARRQRETLSHLRDQQRAAYDLDQARRMQAQVDELFLQRQASRKAPPEP
jgi:flagellar export protein FliJ